MMTMDIGQRWSHQIERGDRRFDLRNRNPPNLPIFEPIRCNLLQPNDWLEREWVTLLQSQNGGSCRWGWSWDSNQQAVDLYNPHSFNPCGWIELWQWMWMWFNGEQGIRNKSRNRNEEEVYSKKNWMSERQTKWRTFSDSDADSDSDDDAEMGIRLQSGISWWGRAPRFTWICCTRRTNIKFFSILFISFWFYFFLLHHLLLLSFHNKTQHLIFSYSLFLTLL